VGRGLGLAVGALDMLGLAVGLWLNVPVSESTQNSNRFVASESEVSSVWAEVSMVKATSPARLSKSNSRV